MNPTTPSRVVAGIDVGGTKILGYRLDLDDPARPSAPVRVDTPRGEQAIVEAISAVVGRLDRPDDAAGGRPPAAIGVGAAGLIDTRGVLRFAPNLPTVLEFDIAGPLRERHGVPVFVANDATAAMAAEHRVGAARGTQHAVLTTLGTGIGAGLVVNGELVLGANGFAGEPGHMVVDPHGPECPCGRRGCWERMASGSGLGRFAREAAEAGRGTRLIALAGGDCDAVRGEHVGLAAREGDAEALAILRTFAWWVALGLANLVDILDPEIVVIGGGLVDMGDLLLDPIRREFAGLVLAGGHRPIVRIEAAELGSEAGAVGAALLAGDLLR